MPPFHFEPDFQIGTGVHQFALEFLLPGQVWHDRYRADTGGEDDVARSQNPFAAIRPTDYCFSVQRSSASS